MVLSLDGIGMYCSATSLGSSGGGQDCVPTTWFSMVAFPARANRLLTEMTREARSKGRIAYSASSGLDPLVPCMQLKVNEKNLRSRGIQG